MSDLPYALRTLRKRPGLAVSAVVALTFCINVNIALFWVVRAMTFDAPHHGGSGRVFSVRSHWNDFAERWAPIPEYHAYRTRLRSLYGLAPLHTSSERLPPVSPRRPRPQ